ncbi:MAG: SH3 domain-containing protein [Chloroflexota bacterium]
MSKAYIWIASLSLFGLLGGIPAAAQSTERFAAILDVIYDGVEIRRNETNAWIAVSAGAVMAFADGDAIRTDENGRALLTLDAVDGEILVLPNTEFALSDYRLASTTADEPLVIGTMVRGETIHRVASAAPNGYLIGGGTAATVESETAHFIASERDGEAVFIVADGMLRFGILQEPIALSAAQAVYQGTRGASEVYTDLPAPTPPASIVGRVQGCAGTIVTESGQNLNARTGPGTNNIQLGQFPNGADVQVMGVVAFGGWYRVQFRSGFGWVQRLALEIDEADCPIPTLPDDSFDLPSTVFDVTEAELDLMTPFYGTPDDDPIFYQRGPTSDTD